jgi:hypothetical protein
VHEALLQCDPDTALGREEAALAARDVWFEHATGSGVSAMTATLDTPDALDLQATIDDLAAVMGRLGDPDPLGVRRSRALATLADPQRTLDLYGNPRPDRVLDRALDGVSDDSGHAAGHGTLDAAATGGRADGNSGPDGMDGGPDGDPDGEDTEPSVTHQPTVDRTVDRAAGARARFGDPRCPGWNRSIGHLYAHVSVSDLIGLTQLGRPGTGPGGLVVEPAAGLGRDTRSGIDARISGGISAGTSSGGGCSGGISAGMGGSSSIGGGIRIDPVLAAGIEALARAATNADDGPGPRLGPVAVLERLGPITGRLAGDWLTRCTKVSSPPCCTPTARPPAPTWCWPPTRPTAAPCPRPPHAPRSTPTTRPRRCGSR